MSETADMTLSRESQRKNLDGKIFIGISRTKTRKKEKLWITILYGQMLAFSQRNSKI